MAMGIGTFLPREAVFKRRYRWAMGFDESTYMGGGGGGKISPIMVTIAARPNVTLEETELNFLNEKAYIASKPTWESLAVTFLDFGKAGGTGADTILRNWIRQCYIYGDPGRSGAMSDPAGYYKRDGYLVMFNGIGDIIEKWRFYGCWVQQANWGDLDYSATENATIECQIRYDNASQEIVSGSGGQGGESANRYAAMDASISI